MRATATLAAVLALALVAAGCGDQAGDLFFVQRTGNVPGALLAMIVTEDGYVTCNGVRHKLPDPRVLDARQLQTDLHEPASKGVVLAPRPNSVFTYFVRTPAGSVRFSDTSSGVTSLFQRIELFVDEVAKGTCGLPQ